MRQEATPAFRAVGFACRASRESCSDDSRSIHLELTSTAENQKVVPLLLKLDARKPTAQSARLNLRMSLCAEDFDERIKALCLAHCVVQVYAEAPDWFASDALYFGMRRLLNEQFSFEQVAEHLDLVLRQ